MDSLIQRNQRLFEVFSILYKDFKDLDDEGRDLPIIWSIAHMFSSAQIAKLVARKRGIDEEISAVIGALHDIGTITTKITKNHAQAGEEPARKFLTKYNSSDFGIKFPFTDEEIEIIIKAIISHSDKDDYTDNPYIEMIKDTDVVDGFLHGIELDGSRRKRCKKTLKELDLKL